MTNDQEPPPRIGSIVLAGAKTAVRAVIKGTPLAVAVDFAETVDKERRKERLELWSAYIAGETDQAEFAHWMDQALVGPERELVRAAVFDSAGAAVDAIDPAVVPAIAKLTNRFLMRREPDRWTVRELLDLLKTLDGEMLDALRGAVAIAALQYAGENVSTEFKRDGEVFVWSAFADRIESVPGGTVSVRRVEHELARGPAAYRLVTALSGPAVGLFRGQPLLNPPHLPTSIVQVLQAIV